MSILVISDSETNRELISAILSVSYPVYSAKSAACGIELAQQLTPEAIVIDIHDDKFDGFSTLQAIKQQPDTQSIPVIVLSKDYAITANAVEGLKLGAFECLANPVDDALLSLKVDAAIHSRRQGLALSYSKGLANKRPDILIVDDATEMQVILEQILSDEGYKIDIASSGNQALALALERQPQLILLDVLMPGLNGYDTCRRIKSNPATEAIPVIFITSEGVTGAEEEGFKAGGVDYITKPINALLLLARVKIHLQLKMYQTSLETVVRQRTMALRQSLEKLSFSNQIKDDFLTIINHELRTPLNGAQGSLFLLQQENLSGEQAELLSSANRSLADLCALVENILILTEAIAGTLKLENNSFCLADLLTQVTQEGKIAAENKSLTFTAHIDTGINDHFSGDATQISRVLWHLVDNAIKFSHQGNISISAIVSEHPNHAELLNFTFAISDQGIGISHDKQELIFQLFKQVKSTSTRRVGGLGVGLPFCQSLVNLMHGNITVDSEEDHGTTVTIKIPLRKCTISAAKQEAVSVKSIAVNKVILIVEDNLVNQLVERKFSEKYGLKAITAANGEEAIVALKNHHIDIILMDCQMPIMDGFEATRHIRQSSEEIKNIPIIAVTANATSFDRNLCEEAGMDDYVPKPIDFNLLTSKLNHWLSSAK